MGGESCTVLRLKLMRKLAMCHTPNCLECVDTPDGPDRLGVLISLIYLCPEILDYPVIPGHPNCSDLFRWTMSL